jgi:hypothetical protein
MWLARLGKERIDEIQDPELAVRDSKGFPKLDTDAVDGGALAGRTRKDIEKQTKRKVVTKRNFLLPQRPLEVSPRAHYYVEK